MKYLSVCSGIEAATVAWHPLGWRPVAFSEIEKFPSQVLAHHYPDTPNYGDMTNFKEWADESIDVLVGGTPCQSFSVAGLRKGMADPRGNLALVYLAIADKYRPKWIVWENVPGVLSSAGGRDFGSFLGALAQLGYGWAYRVLDAQYVRVEQFPRAVPQRRRRVFVVGHLGDWRSAAAVLFESPSLRRDTPPRREKGQSITPSVAHCLETTSHDYSRADGFNMIPMTFKVRGGVEREDGSRGSTNVGKQAGKGFLGSTERAFTVASSQDQWLHHAMAVRRLTPVECERLQGFPDNYTNIRDNTPDGPRYKALGNSMAVPVMRWIGSRIQLLTT